MRTIVICGCLVGALVLGGCDESSSGGGAAPAPSASAAPSAAPASPAASNSAKPEPEKPKKAEGIKDHKARIKALADAFAAHDAKKVAALYAEDGVMKSAGNPDVKGRADIEAHTGKLFAAFKDITLTPGRTWDKDKHTLVTEWVVKGTSTTDAPDMGIPKATNKPFGVVGASLFEVNDDGFIKEEHVYWDAMTLVAQAAPDKDKKEKKEFRPVVTAAPDGNTWFESSMAKEGDKKDKAEKKDDKEHEAEKKDLEEEDKLVGEINAGKLKDAVKRLADDLVLVDYTEGKDLKGKKGFEERLGVWLKAFPDMKGKPSNAFGDGDFVVQEIEITGTQKGPLGAIKPSTPPKSVSIHELQVDQFKDGKVVKSWSWGNSAELLSQLGVMPVEDKKDKKK